MSNVTKNTSSHSVKQIDQLSIHKITSGQVVIDLQTAVKELIENSLDAGATNLGKFLFFRPTCSHYQEEVKFKQYGLDSIEVVDNGSGIDERDHDSIGMCLMLLRGL